MIELAHHIRADCDESADGSEPGVRQVMPLDAETAEWLWPQLKRAAELLRARAQPTLPFARAA